MIRSFRAVLIGGVFSTLLFLGESALADQPCQLVQYASLDLGTDPSGGVYVPMTINGHVENLLVDTGGLASMLTASTVQQLGLPATDIYQLRQLMMVDGFQFNKAAFTDVIQLGNMKATHMPFLVMPDDHMAGEAGTLAPDIMQHYDVELDFAKGKFNLFAPEQCKGQVVYWTHEPYAVLPAESVRMGQFVISIQLDGKIIQATVDTGSSRSFLDFERTRHLFDWDDKTPDLKVVEQRPDGAPASYRYPFKSLTFSGVTVANPDIELKNPIKSNDPRHPSPWIPSVLGMDVLRHLHIYLAYHDESIYVTSADAR